MQMNFPKHPDLAAEVGAYLRAHDMPVTTFGAKAAGDPALIKTLSNGRELRSDLLRRIRMYMATGQEHRATRAGAAQ
jgi:hypothetical protein